MGEIKQMLFELCISKQAKGSYSFGSPALCGRQRAWWRFLGWGPVEEEEGGQFLERAGGGECVMLPQGGEVKRLQ